MYGSKMAIQSAVCYADMDTCVFKCRDGLSTCGKKGTYKIDKDNCPGVDTDNQGQPGGGCKDPKGQGRDVTVSLF